MGGNLRYASPIMLRKFVLLCVLDLLILGCGDDGATTSSAIDDGAAQTGTNESESDTDTAGDTDPGSDSDSETDPDTDGETGGQSWPDPDDAPSYDGQSFVNMKIYDVEAALWLDELALLESLDPVRLIFVGEQHQTAAIHELQRWVLEREILRHGHVTLAMEQFNADNQSVIDAYLAGDIDAATFEANADPWSGYALYWKQLVETMRLARRPLIALNVPSDALDAIYSAFPAPPLEVFNGWDGSVPYDPYLPPRPLASWDAVYQDYFEGSFDYGAHGRSWGLSYDEALDYFTALALIRDDTMGFHVAHHLETTNDRVLVVAGDWHVHSGIATPDSVGKFADIDDYRLITTATSATFPALRDASHDGRAVADYLLVYDPS
jgi:uncharacterized iron-regulated protein